jgi:transcriptional regulator with XRE-family HTH domain
MKLNERALIRKRAGLTQHRLARLTGICASTISLWECGQIELRPEQVARVAKILKEHLGKTPCFDEAGELAKVLVPTAFVPMEAA